VRTLIAATADGCAFLREVLAQMPETKLIAETADGRIALEQIRRMHPGLILLDISLEQMTGLAVARQAIRDLPDTPVVIVSAIDEPAYLLEALRIGVTGYLLTTIPAHDLACSIRRILAGETLFDMAFAMRTLQTLIMP